MQFIVALSLLSALAAAEPLRVSITDETIAKQSKPKCTAGTLYCGKDILDSKDNASGYDKCDLTTGCKYDLSDKCDTATTNLNSSLFKCNNFRGKTDNFVFIFDSACAGKCASGKCVTSTEEHEGLNVQIEI